MSKHRLSKEERWLIAFLEALSLVSKFVKEVRNAKNQV